MADSRGVDTPRVARARGRAAPQHAATGPQETREHAAAERLAAEAVDRMIARLDTATATVEAQLAELRRMRRAA
ncbi:hypothetical protein [Roseicella aquatilis]|uniref:Uncharacterized protein n=1 Tax=Roseicella aquatilis TaxID=2527868 RepID=A0A4R4DDS2_9PROT|nr:hypothetical protein [Roseicella aquatilis]TCZ58748.1 hypothetical protein EXY23_16180 [Roseicella aquatilis]